MFKIIDLPTVLTLQNGYGSCLGLAVLVALAGTVTTGPGTPRAGSFAAPGSSAWWQPKPEVTAEILAFNFASPPGPSRARRGVWMQPADAMPGAEISSVLLVIRGFVLLVIWGFVLLIIWGF